MQLDNYNQLVGQGITIYGSRERIRSQLIDFAKDYLQLKTVDFYKTSVMSYIVDTLSILSANHLFYDSVIYREFFMVEAQMQESVYNLARWIGYEIPKAVPSKADIMFTIPLSFSSSTEVTFNIPNTFKAYAGNTVFTIDSISQSDVSGNNIPAARFIFSVDKYKQKKSAAAGKIIDSTILTVQDSRGFNRPVFISSDGNYGSFNLPFTQQERIVTQFLVPGNIQQYQFYSKLLQFSGMVAQIKVWIAEPPYGQKINLDTVNSPNFDPNIPATTYSNSGVTSNATWNLWEESPHGIYTMAPGVSEYVFVGGINQGELFFGNGILGRQPPPNAAVTVELYITKGEDGKVIPYAITKGDPISYNSATDVASQSPNKLFNVSYMINNPVQSIGGENTPTLPEIKRRAIINLRSKERLVSDDDYNDINTIMGASFPTVETYPILKRSDLKVNEIMCFVRLLYHDETFIPQVVPTRNVKFPVYNPTFVEDKYTVYRSTKVMIDNNYYETLFNITIDKSTMMASYDYILQDIVGSPVSLYEQREYSWYQQYTYMPMSTIDFNIELPNSVLSSSSSSSDNTSVYPLSVKAHVNYIPNDDAPEDYKLSAFRCRMITKWGDLQEYDADLETVIVDGQTQYYFYFEIPNYLDVPTEVQRFEFYIDGYGFLRDAQGFFINVQGQRLVDDHGNPITDPTLAVEGWMQLSKNYTDVLVRKDLSDVMFSTVTKTSYWDGEYHLGEIRYDIHNTPTILSSYLDDGQGGGVLNRVDNQQYPNFETTVMQGLIGSLNMIGTRMLTDSINIKFPDTYGTLNNLKYNPVDDIVESRFHTPFRWESPNGIIFVVPDGGSSSSSSEPSGTKYIVNGEVPGYSPTYELASYINSIAELYVGAGSHGEDIWYLTPPTRGMYVKVKDELDENGDEKIVVYSGSEWIDAQSFSIPLKLVLKVEIDPTVNVSGSAIKDTIKQTLVDHFSPYMGTQKSLDRSEINQVVRDISGVIYCEVLKPEVDIKFLYDINHDLTQQQLIDYTPQYMGFTIDSIEVDIIT